MNKSIKFGGGVQPSVKQRSSNLELLRIFAMLTIIASHSVINAGIPELYDYSDVSANMLFLQLFAMWGKTAINVFVLISGYFMCKSDLTINRFSKVYLEVKFYKFLIFAVMLIMGYEVFSLKGVFKLVFGFANGINNGFTYSFLAFYLFVPFYNILIKNIDEKKHRLLIIFSIFTFTITTTFFVNGTVFNELGWYIALYFVAAYIRLYPCKWMSNNKVCAPILVLLVLSTYAFVVFVDFIGARFGFTAVTYLTSDSSKILAFLIGVFSFLTFKNMQIKNSKFINTVASTTFGVFLIHANSSAMREFLWFDLVDSKGHYNLPLSQVVLFFVGVVLAVFVCGSIIDLFRIKLIEKPLFKWLNKFDWFNKPIV